MQELPEELGKCTELKSLILYKNQLTKLPESLSNLTKITEINCFNNKILKLTHSTGKLAAATEVNFSANKVRRPRYCSSRASRLRAVVSREVLRRRQARSELAVLQVMKLEKQNVEDMTNVTVFNMHDPARSQVGSKSGPLTRPEGGGRAAVRVECWLSERGRTR